VLNGGAERADLGAAHLLAGMDEDVFLGGPPGPDGEVAEPDVDDVFAKAWETVLREQSSCAADAPDPTGAAAAAEAGGGRYLLLPVSCGVLALDSAPRGGGPPAPVGGYLGCDLALDPAHRGQGLGAELVLARFVWGGDLPTWGIDVPAYSRAGVAAHRAARRLGRSRPDLVARMESAFSAPPEPDPGQGVDAWSVNP